MSPNGVMKSFGFANSKDAIHRNFQTQDQVEIVDLEFYRGRKFDNIYMLITKHLEE